MARSIETKTLNNGGKRYFCFDCSMFKEVLAGETLVSATVTGPTLDGFTIGSPAINTEVFDGVPVGKGVVFLVTTTTATPVGNYPLEGFVTTSGGAIIDPKGRLVID